MSLWLWLVEHETILTTLLGTIVGAILGSTGTIALTWWHNRKAQRVAKMQVATLLRHWANKVYRYSTEAKTFVSSGELGGRYHFQLPDMRLESHLASIASIESRFAERIFDLIHQKDEANEVVSSALDYIDPDDAQSEFLGAAASLYLATADIHRELATSLGWSQEALSADARQAMLDQRRQFDDMVSRRSTFRL